VLTSGDVKQNLELDLVLGKAPVDQPADHGVEQDDEDGPQGREKEGQPLVLRPPLRSVGACRPNQIEHRERCQAHGCIQGCAGQTLEGVNEDNVGCLASRETGNAHHGRDLAHDNVEGRARHEGREGGERDDIDDPPASDKADKEDDGTGEDRKSGGDNVGRDVRQSGGQVGNNAAGKLRHDGDRLR